MTFAGPRGTPTISYTCTGGEAPWLYFLFLKKTQNRIHMITCRAAKPAGPHHGSINVTQGARTQTNHFAVPRRPGTYTLDYISFSQLCIHSFILPRLIE